METMFIMKGIELPDDKNGPKTRYPFESMLVGDSFFLENREASKFSPYAGKFGRRENKKFQVRNVHMRKKMDGDRQVGWELATSGDVGAVSGCLVRRLADTATPDLSGAGSDKQPDPVPAPDAAPEAAKVHEAAAKAHGKPGK